jgi:hypothetical protein
MVRSINLLSLKLICLGRAIASFFRLDVRGGEKPGFFENSWLQSEIWPKTRFLRFWVEAETGFFSEDIDTPPKNCEKPGFFDLCRSLGLVGWRETGFFPESLVAVGDLTKNPVSEIFGVARNRVFSDDIDTPPKNCEKPGFCGLCRSLGCVGWRETGFFPE